MPAVIFAIGLLLRVLMLTGPKSFWGDEWFSLGLAQRSFAEVFWASIHDVHPPFYFLLLRAAVCCFGQGEWAFRLVSFVAGLGTLAAVYRLSRLIFQNQTARWAIFLTAISPYWLQSSNEVRSYSLLGFLASLTAVFFAEALCHPEKKFWKWAYAMSAIFLVYTEHYGWFLVAAAIAAQGYLWTRKKLPTGFGNAQRVMLIFAVPSLCLIGYQAVFGEHMFDLSRVREYFAWPLILKKIVGIFWHFSSGYRFSMLTIDRVFFYLKSSPFFWVSAVNTLAVLLVALKGFFGLRREKFEWGLLFGITLFFPVVFLGIFYPIRLDARYLSFAAPFFFILAADGLRRISARSVRAVVLAVLIFVSLEGSQYAISAVTDPAHKEDYRGLVSYVYANAAASDAICGLEQQASYYRKRLGLQTPADYFARIDDLAAAGPSAYRVVWLMDGANMHPEVTRQAYRQIIEIMKKLGFEPAAEPRKFGGEEALTVLYKFREITA